MHRLAADRVLDEFHPADKVLVKAAIETCRSSGGYVGLLCAGSYASGTYDAYSDLDLIVVLENEREFTERAEFLSGLGPLLTSFTGEHVGEPRLFICLYGPPLRHVDVKFIELEALASRADDPVVLHDPDGRIASLLSRTTANWPATDSAYLSPRFWTWVHYAAAKVGRGECLEALSAISLIREVVLGPLIALATGRSQRGTRYLETFGGDLLPLLRNTVAKDEPADLLRALGACVALYDQLRARIDPGREPERVRKLIVEFLAELEAQQQGSSE